MWHQVSKTPKYPIVGIKRLLSDLFSCLPFLWAHLITLCFNKSYIFSCFTRCNIKTLILVSVQKICYLIASGFKQCCLDCWFEYNFYYLVNLKTTALHPGVKTETGAKAEEDDFIIFFLCLKSISRRWGWIEEEGRCWKRGKKGKRRRRRGSGDGGQELNLSLRWKANGNRCGTNMRIIPGNCSAVGGSSGSSFLFFCANGREMEEEDELERETDIYISLDQTRRCQLNWCRSSPEEGERVDEEQRQRKKKEEGKRWEGAMPKKKKKKNEWKSNWKRSVRG